MREAKSYTNYNRYNRKKLLILQCIQSPVAGYQQQYLTNHSYSDGWVSTNDNNLLYIIYSYSDGWVLTYQYSTIHSYLDSLLLTLIVILLKIPNSMAGCQLYNNHTLLDIQNCMAYINSQYF